jgi:hypothetical protein
MSRSWALKETNYAALGTDFSYGVEGALGLVPETRCCCSAVSLGLWRMRKLWPATP